MIHAKVKFKCKCCGKSKDWYIMPKKEKTKSNDYTRSIDKFELVCKNCKKSYTLTIKITTD
jgi:hypothetical protein